MAATLAVAALDSAVCPTPDITQRPGSGNERVIHTPKDGTVRGCHQKWIGKDGDEAG
jgi:hypothetical protein